MQKPQQRSKYYRQVQRAILLGSSVVLVACGGGDSGTSTAPKPSVPIITAYQALEQPLGREVSTCNLVLNKTNAAFLEELTLTGLPENFAEPSFRIIANDGKNQYVNAGFFNQIKAGEPLRLIAPIHPITPLSGGKVTLEVGDGALRCPTITLNVAAVPAADPKILTRINQKIEQWLDLTIQQLGADPAALATATADTIQPDLIPFAIAKKSLAANGTLTQQAQQAIIDNNQVVAGVMQGSQIEAQLDAAIAELQALPRPTATRATLKPASQPRIALTPKAAPPIHWLNPTPADPIALSKNRPIAQPKNAALCAGQQFPPNPLPISSAAELSQRMLAAQKGYVIGSNEQTQIGQMLGSYALAGSSTANHAGTGLYVIKTIENAKRALEPTELTSYQIGRFDGLLIEDRPASQAGRWDGANLTAQGQTFNISSSILEGLLTAVGMTPGVVGVAVTATGTAFANPINNLVNELTQESCIKIDAPKYGPFNVSDEEWTEFSVIGDAVERLSQRTYIGQNIGAAELQFKLRTEKFASNRILIEKRNVVVQEQQISLSPSQSRVREAGETVEIIATIPNSFVNKGNLDATVLTPNTRILSRQRSNDQYVLRIATPTDRQDYPVRIEFETLNPVLPPAVNNTRSAIATINLGGQIILSQPSACVVPNSTFELTAEISGFSANQRDIDWLVTGPARLISTQPNADGTRVVATIQTTGAGNVEITANASADLSVQARRVANVSERCLVKTQIVGMGISAPISSTDSDGGEGCLAAQDMQVREEKYQTDENPTQIPDLPRESERWFNRSERVTVQNQTASVSVQRANANNSGCNRATVSSNTRADIRVYGGNDGTLGFDFDADLQGSCSLVKSGDQDEVFCANSNAVVSSGGFHYLDIERDTTVLVEGELKCAGLSGVVGFTPMSLIALRYESTNGGLTQYVSSQLSESLIADKSGNPLPPVLWANVQCRQANQTIQLSQEVVFKKPRQSGKTDRIIFSSTGNAFAGITGTTRAGFGMFGTEPTDLVEPKVGNYRSTAKVNFLIRITPK